MKYVIVENNGLPGAILAPEWVEHAQLVTRGVRVVSAGFCQCAFHAGSEPTYERWGVKLVGHVKVTCWGASSSLHVASRPEDADIIEHELRTPGRRSDPFPVCNRHRSMIDRRYAKDDMNVKCKPL